MGLGYLAAFFSLAWQIGALYDADGLAPVAQYLGQVERFLSDPFTRWMQVPSVFWINSSDAVLNALAWTGVVLSLLVTLNLGARFLLPVLWILYLSFVSVGPPFLNFQWDILLLEMGFLAALFALTERPSLLFLWLLRWLCFRLMWLNGVVKILAVDRDYLDGTSSTWWEGTALSYHYFSQPLPAWPAWFFHHLPPWWHTASTYGVLAVELAVPFLVFLGRRPRLVAAIAFAGLHLLIWVAGSQAFYNLLGLALLIPLLDDRVLAAGRRWLGLDRLARWQPWLPRLGALWGRGLDLGLRGGWFRSKEARMASYSVQLLVAGILFLLSIFVLNQRLEWFRTPDWMDVVLRDASPYHLVSNYGAFSNMTRTRPEFVLEGSDDRRNWQEYEFWYKPGAPDRAPGWAAPYQPRVDWQMWFAALGAHSPWLDRVTQAIGRHDPDFLRLLRTNPFPDGPPKYLRLVKYDYEFTGWEEGWESGRWWKREQLGRSQVIPLHLLPGEF